MPEPTAAILRNIGVPVRLYVLDEGGDVRRNADDEEVTTTKHIRFTANTCVALEETWPELAFSEDVPIMAEGEQARHADALAKGQTYEPRVIGYRQVTRTFYGIEAWQRALERKPATTLRATMALVLGVDADVAGRMMLPSETATYNISVGVAWAMAQGVDPATAGKMLAASKKAANKAMSERFDLETLNRQFDALLGEESPNGHGQNGSAPGSDHQKDKSSDSAEPTPSSGISAPRKSPTRSSPASRSARSVKTLGD